MADSSYGHHCLVCNKGITWRFAICAACEQIYGSTSSQWPDWLAYLWRDHVRERRRNHTISRYEITTSDLTYTRMVQFEETVEDFYEQ
jgi:hypothetical protein